MSDLHRAVRAEIAAHTPALPPSFDALKARKRTRDRRRSAAAVAATAVAVAGVAFLPVTLAGGSGSARSPVAQDAGDSDVFGFGVKAVDAKLATAEGGGGPEALQRCLELPGLSNVGAQYSYPGQYSGRVTGSGNAEAFKSCVDAVPGWAAALTPVAAAEAARTYKVQPSVRTVANSRLEEQRDACFALPGVEAVDVDESLPLTYRVTVPASGAEAFERCIGAVVGLYVPELAPEGSDADAPELVWTGVTVCRLGGQGPDDCQFFGEEEASALDDALDTATPAPGGQVYCGAAGPAYTVQFDHPSARTIVITVRVGCGPMSKGGVDYLLPGQAQRLVQQVHVDAGTGDSAEAFIDRCLDRSAGTAADEYVGKTVTQAEALAVSTGATIRVFGRDGTCLGGRYDLREERVNVLLVRDQVIWARRF